MCCIFLLFLVNFPSILIVLIYFIVAIYFTLFYIALYPLTLLFQIIIRKLKIDFFYFNFQNSCVMKHYIINLRVI